MTIAIKVETEEGIALCLKSELLKLHPGDEIIIAGERGEEIGKVLPYPDIPITTQLRQKKVLKEIKRKMTEDDKERRKENSKRENEIFETCLKKIKEENILIKLITADYSFDGKMVTLYFTAKERVDFRDLVRDIASLFNVKVEMRQISIREEAKRVGGCGSCGRPFCCTTFIKEFEPTTITMAKEQGISLDPDKVCGPCGRILCCIRYEYQTYVEMSEKLPPQGSRVTTGKVNGKVIALNPLRQRVTLDLGDGHKIDVPIANLKMKSD
jgi:cell fate regulator YaaT (PSP1 superfamily)